MRAATELHVAKPPLIPVLKSHSGTLLDRRSASPHALDDSSVMLTGEHEQSQSCSEVGDRSDGEPWTVVQRQHNTSLLTQQLRTGVRNDRRWPWQRGRISTLTNSTMPGQQRTHSYRNELQRQLSRDSSRPPQATRRSQCLHPQQGQQEPPNTPLNDARVIMTCKYEPLQFLCNLHVLARRANRTGRDPNVVTASQSTFPLPLPASPASLQHQRGTSPASVRPRHRRTHPPLQCTSGRAHRSFAGAGASAAPPRLQRDHCTDGRSETPPPYTASKPRLKPHCGIIATTLQSGPRETTQLTQHRPPHHTTVATDAHTRRSLKAVRHTTGCGRAAATTSTKCRRRGPS
jgi:hypothetical protein